MHEFVNARRPVLGDKVERDAATCNQGKVRLGDRRPGVRAAPARSGRQGRA